MAALRTPNCDDAARLPARVVAGSALTVGSVSMSHLKSWLVSPRSRPGCVTLAVVRQVAVTASSSRVPQGRFLPGRPDLREPRPQLGSGFRALALCLWEWTRPGTGVRGRGTGVFPTDAFAG